MRGFGAHRENVAHPFGGKEFEPEKLQSCEGVIPLQSGTNAVPSQAGETPIGAKRRTSVQVGGQL